MRFLNGWSLAILLLVILPAGGFVSVELLQRHRYTTVVARLEAALRDLETDVRMECMDPPNVDLKLATGVSMHPIRLTLKREFRNEDLSWDRICTWDLTGACDRHKPRHGLRMEFQVRQERRIILRNPKVTLRHNDQIPPSLEPLLKRALQGLDANRFYFQYCEG